MNMNEQIIPDISSELASVSDMLAKVNKRNKVKPKEIDYSLHETRKAILINLLTNASEMYSTAFKPRKPNVDYRFWITELHNGFYEISAMRHSSPTEAELSYTHFEYINAADMGLDEIRYYIRNKMYCFIHMLYEYHNREKYGAEKVEKQREIRREKSKFKFKDI